MQIIAALDLWEGKVVRLWQGDFDQRTQVAVSVEAAGEQFLRWGLHRWHIVDLEGARQGQLRQKALLAELRRHFPQVRMSLGGGLRTEAEVEWAFSVGFDWVVLGSVAVTQPEAVEKWMQLWGKERFILAADARREKVVLAGWQETAELTVEAFLRRWREQQPAAFLCTQIERDGTLSGPAVEELARLQAIAAPVPVIASGGIRGPADLEALRQAGISAAVVGKALYTDPQAQDWIKPFLPS